MIPIQFLFSKIKKNKKKIIKLFVQIRTKVGSIFFWWHFKRNMYNSISQRHLGQLYTLQRKQISKFKTVQITIYSFINTYTHNRITKTAKQQRTKHSLTQQNNHISFFVGDMFYWISLYADFTENCPFTNSTQAHPLAEFSLLIWSNGIPQHPLAKLALQPPY